ncbi:hypothetical protein [Boudabousia marimammalium]|uniref:Uncharacterized protein n=1 Tax=Boudabousia marimammalium TaxID=156892 RepID=A0A1Q5PP95_9ACTO|nr:hypothetical protein [Boudabousia marimammalium]OKL49357.1 hypothetical protein BM477_05115 [Boudabousia marimammalium]
MSEKHIHNPLGNKTYRRKYYTLIAFYYILAMIIIAFAGGAAQIYINRTFGLVVTIGLVIAAWVGYKRISRAYESNRLFTADGRLRNLSKEDDSKNFVELKDNAATPDLSHLSAKDRARIEEVERQRRAAQKKKNS